MVRILYGLTRAKFDSFIQPPHIANTEHLMLLATNKVTCVPIQVQVMIFCGDYSGYTNGRASHFDFDRTEYQSIDRGVEIVWGEMGYGHVSIRGYRDMSIHDKTMAWPRLLDSSYRPRSNGR